MKNFDREFFFFLFCATRGYKLPQGLKTKQKTCRNDKPSKSAECEKELLKPVISDRCLATEIRLKRYWVIIVPSILSRPWYFIPKGLELTMIM
jgi:hypothetical protein